MTASVQHFRFKLQFHISRPILDQRQTLTKFIERSAHRVAMTTSRLDEPVLAKSISGRVDRAYLLLKWYTLVQFPINCIFINYNNTGQTNATENGFHSFPA